MNNSVKSVTFFVLGSIIWLILYVSVIKPKNTPIVEETNTNQLLVENQKLKSENDSLRAELQSQAQRTDFKEKKYKEILFEYELGIDRIKNYHPNAYEDFHRILAYKEDYSIEAEIENKKRLKDY
jgi:regulator of replication initiation timing